MLYDNGYMIDSIPQNDFQLADITQDYCSETGCHAIKLMLNSCSGQLS